MNILTVLRNSGKVVSLLVLITAVDYMSGGFCSNLSATKKLGKPPVGLHEEYYTAGKTGTVFNTTSRCLEMASPAIDADEELSRRFPLGELFFNADFVTDTEMPFGGLGPVYNNNSCRNCHPNYGRARRVEKFTTQLGNGYIVFVHTPEGKIVDGYKFMLQTMAVPPYEPPAKGVDITWNDFVDEYGNKYPDGTPYNHGKPTEGTLVYPTAKLIEPLLPLPDDYKVSIEATIGTFGVGLLDAIRDEDIIAEFERQKAMPGPIKGMHGRWILQPHSGKERLGKFTYHNTRATLQHGPCFNGAWSVYNITRKDRGSLFATQQWIDKQGELGFDVEKLSGPQPVEMTEEELDDFMVWVRGLGVPAARNLGDPEVQKGRKAFKAIGCNECHKPSWTTGEYSYMPAYEGQKIWPYTDLLMHDMGEINYGLRKTYRTTPLWARGLMHNAVDHSDMFHDLRARDFEEAILWHFGTAKESREKFRQMSADERSALIKFLKAI